MPGRIRQEDIAAVRERSAIADVVGEYLQLRPAGGGSLKGLCPFHDEKTPSFNVTPGKELYYCFSCTAGGDVIKFVQEIEHLSFAEAIERLAARAGVELRYEQGGYVPGQETSQRRRGVPDTEPLRVGQLEATLSQEAWLRAVRRGAVRCRVLPGGVGRAHQAPARPRVHR
jgi:DNA primase